MTQESAELLTSASVDGDGFPSHEEIEFYRLYRDRIVCEDGLISQRLSWLITTQTVMFSFTAIAFFGGARERIDSAGTLLMCVLGVLTCFVGAIGVWTASHRIDEVRAEYDRKHPRGRPHPALPNLVGRSATHFVGKAVPLVVPPLFMLAWLAILVIALR